MGWFLNMRGCALGRFGLGLWLAVAGLAGGALAAPLPEPPVDLAGPLTPQAIHALDGWLQGQPWTLDWDALIEALGRRGPGELGRYARAAAQLARLSFAGAEAAQDELRSLRAEALARGRPADRVLAAELLSSLGRWQLVLRHPGAGLASLGAAQAELRRLGHDPGLARALWFEAGGRLAQTRQPADALPVLQELGRVAHRAGLEVFQRETERLLGEWQKAMAEAEDHFGRSRRRLSVFSPSLGIPEDADLVALGPAGLLMNGDTDDQVEAAAPRLALFDGLFVRTLELPGEGLELRGSAVDGRGRVWLATNRGLFCLDGRTLRQRVNPELGDEEENGLRRSLAGEAPGVERLPLGLPSNVVNEVKPGPDGRLYLATSAGLAILDEARDALEVIGERDAPVARRIERVAPLPDGGLVVAWRDEYAVRAPDGRWSRHPFVFQGPAGPEAGHLYGLLVDREGRAWVHGLMGALRLAGARVERVVDRAFHPVTRNVNHVLLARDGAFWFATPRGLCRQEGRGCALLDESRWLTAEWALDLLEGPGGEVWMSAYLGGLTRLGPPHQRSYGLVDGFLQPMNTSLARLGEALYFSHPRGLTRLEPATGRFDHFLFGNEGLPLGTASQAALVELEDERLAFVDPELAGGKRLVLFDGLRGLGLGVEAGLPDEVLRGVCQPAPGQLLVATRGGLHEVDLTSLRAAPRPGLELGGRELAGLVCAPGEPVWLLAKDESLLALEGDRVVPLELASRGLAGRVKGVIASPTAGRLVVGERGVLRFRRDRFEPVPLEPERFDFRVRDVEADAAGRLYFATESGVYVTDGESWTRLTVEDGLLTDSAHEMLLVGETLWVTGKGGVVAWRWPEAEPPETFLAWQGQATRQDPRGRTWLYRASDGVERPEAVLLRGLAGLLEVDEAGAGALLEGRAGLREDLAEPVWRTAQNTLEARVSGGVPWLDDRPESLTYFHRLDGGAWRRLEGTSLRLEGLADGEHVLEVRATDTRLRRDATPARLRFQVDTPVSPWSLGAGGLLAVGLVGVNRRRLVRLWRRAQHRRFRPIEPSPFTPSRPAEGAGLVGREPALEELVRLALGGGAAAVVWGPRGSGKHSFMRAAAGRLRAAGVLTVELDLAAATAGADAGALVQGLERRIQEALASAGPPVVLDSPRLPEPGASPDPELGSLPSASQENPFQRLVGALARLERARPGVRLALLMDNAEALGMAVDADASFGSFLFPFLRSLVQERASLSLVLALEGRWFDLARRFDALLAFATPIPMERLSDPAVAGLYARAFQGRAFLDAPALERLLRLAGGLPQDVQRLGQRLVETLNARATNLIGLESVEQAADGLVTDRDRRLEAAWLALGREECLVACALAEGGPLSSEALLARLAAVEVRLLPEELRRNLLALVRDGVLVELPGAFGLRSELFGLWIQRHHSVASTAALTVDCVGSYQLLDRLGAGGMGVVYRARDLAHGATVALKLLRPELAEHKRSRQRFLREARLGKTIRHPSAVRILDYGEQGGRLYLAMEFLEGHSLARWARSPRRPGALEVAQAGRVLASALGALHRLGVVHRDVKVDNVMVVGGADPARDPLPTACLKLMDFGLAVGEDVSRVTRAGALVGTLGSMAPEQARGEAVDARADLYSLGVLLFELWTGCLPFSGHETAVLEAVLHTPAPDPAGLRPGLPEPLRALLLALLEKQPSDRPSSAAEVEQRLAAMLPGLEAEARAAGAEVPPGPPVPEPSRGGLITRTLDAMVHGSRLLESLSSVGGSGAEPDGSVPLDLERSLLVRVSAIVARGLQAEDGLGQALELTTAALSASGGLLALGAPAGEGGGLSQAAAVAHPQDALASSRALGELVRRAVDQRMGLLLLGDPDDPDGEPGALAAAPLWAGDQILGALLVDRRGPGARAFDDRDLELLVCVGYLLGLGLERERLLAAALDQARLAAVGQMLAGVAHDLKNPMAVVSGYAEMLEEPQAPGQTLQAARTIRRQVDAMLDMIGNLLAFARGEHELMPAEVEPAALAEEVREALSLLGQARRVELHLEAAGPAVRLDPARLRRILLNLGKNALEATPAEGSLTIRVRGQAAGLDLEVEDTGPGLPDEVRRRLFEPFVSVGKQGGTGLGLAIVKRFVDDHAGRIEVASSPEAGTTFRVHLPACPG